MKAAWGGAEGGEASGALAQGIFMEELHGYELKGLSQFQLWDLDRDP